MARHIRFKVPNNLNSVATSTDSDLDSTDSGMYAEKYVVGPRLRMKRQPEESAIKAVDSQLSDSVEDKEISEEAKTSAEEKIERLKRTPSRKAEGLSVDSKQTVASKEKNETKNESQFTKLEGKQNKPKEEKKSEHKSENNKSTTGNNVDKSNPQKNNTQMQSVPKISTQKRDIQKRNVWKQPSSKINTVSRNQTFNNRSINNNISTIKATNSSKYRQYRPPQQRKNIKSCTIRTLEGSRIRKVNNLNRKRTIPQNNRTPYATTNVNVKRQSQRISYQRATVSSDSLKVDKGSNNNKTKELKQNPRRLTRQALVRKPIKSESTSNAKKPKAPVRTQKRNVAKYSPYNKKKNDIGNNLGKKKTKSATNKRLPNTNKSLTNSKSLKTASMSKKTGVVPDKSITDKLGDNKKTPGKFKFKPNIGKRGKGLFSLGLNASKAMGGFVVKSVFTSNNFLNSAEVQNDTNNENSMLIDDKTTVKTSEKVTSTFAKKTAAFAKKITDYIIRIAKEIAKRVIKLVVKIIIKVITFIIQTIATIVTTMWPVILIVAAVASVVAVVLSILSAVGIGGDSSSGGADNPFGFVISAPSYITNAYEGKEPINRELSQEEINEMVAARTDLSEEDKKIYVSALSKVGTIYSQEERMSLDAYDCSSLAYTVCRENGKDIPEGPAATQAETLVHDGKGINLSSDGTFCDISVADLKTGDLIFYGGQYNNGRYLGIHHVAIYVGEGMAVEAYGEDHGVVYQPLRIKDNEPMVACRP